jgi:hypothetical protein
MAFLPPLRPLRLCYRVSRPCADEILAIILKAKSLTFFLIFEQKTINYSGLPQAIRYPVFYFCSILSSRSPILFSEFFQNSSMLLIDFSESNFNFLPLFVALVTFG